MGRLQVKKAWPRARARVEQRQVSIKVLLLAAVFLAYGFVGQGTYVTEERSLVVFSPPSLAGNYDVAMSSFGRPAYAGSVLGALQVPGLGITSCTDFSKFGVSFKKSDSDYRHSPIAMVQSSGDCDFAWKVFNAQNAGAVGVVIVDSVDQPLERLANSPFASPSYTTSHLMNVTIPSVLINKTLGDLLKKELTDGKKAVNLKLEWGEAPKEPVEYEIWTISQDKCGRECDTQVQFVQNFRGVAQNLEKGGYTVFTPHYIVWFCPPTFLDTPECQSQCINNGRYCSPDPEDDFSAGYEGKDVVTENLRQICLHKLLRQQKRPWIWWDYVADFQVRCSMRDGKYNKDCGNSVAFSLDLNVTEIIECMGDSSADANNELLKAEQESQAGNGGDRGDITITPTLVISNRQYKGKLENGAVLKSLCSHFLEGAEPTLCLRGVMETDECLVNNGGCWIHSNGLVTACRDTFKGRVCECPYYEGVQFEGDGYTNCQPVGSGRCKIDNAGCWSASRNNMTFSACSDALQKGCECPEGFTGDGKDLCEDVDECTQKTRCQCPECSCRDTWGSYDCSCSGDLIYLRENDACVRRKASTVKVVWLSFGVVGLAVLSLLVAGFVVYKYKVRSYMDARIRATLAQYMPLDSSNQDIYRHLQEEES